MSNAENRDRGRIRASRSGLPYYRLQGYRPSRDLPDGIAQITAEITEETAVRLLLAADSDSARTHACRRARALAESISATARRRALLYAHLLLTECLAAVSSLPEAEQVFLSVLEECARSGLIQSALDAGPVRP